MQDGICDALEKQYLRSFVFAIYLVSVFIISAVIYRRTGMISFLQDQNDPNKSVCFTSLAS